MGGSAFGILFCVTTAGESYGPGNVANVSPHEAWVAAMRWARQQSDGHGFCGGG